MNTPTSHMTQKQDGEAVAKSASPLGSRLQINVIRLKNPSYTMESSRSRPYLCKLCGRKVHTISALQQHTRIHRSIFPYQCSVCSKSFRLLSQLRGHQFLHNNEKPLMCGWCDEHFIEQHQLGHHLLRKHKITARCIGTKLVVANPESLTMQTYNMATGERTLIIKKTECTMVEDDNMIAEINPDNKSKEDGQSMPQEPADSEMDPQTSVYSVTGNGEVPDLDFSEINPSSAGPEPSGSPLDSDNTVSETGAPAEVKAKPVAKRKLSLEEPLSVENMADDVDCAMIGESKEVMEIESFMDMNGNAMGDNEVQLCDTQDVVEINSDTETLINTEAGGDVMAPVATASTDRKTKPAQGDDAEVNEAIMLLTGLDNPADSSEGKEMPAGGETLGEESGFHLAMMTDDDSRSLTNPTDSTQNVLRGDPSLHMCPSRDDLFSFEENVAFTEDAEMMERAKQTSSELSSMVPAWSSSCGNLAGLMLSGTPQKLSVDPGAASVTASPAMSPFRATIGHGGSDSEDSDTEVASRQNIPVASIEERGDQGAQGPVTADKESSISPGHTETSNDLPIQPNAINFIKTAGMSSFPNLKSLSGQDELQKSTLNDLKTLTENVQKEKDEETYKGYISLPQSLPTNMKLVKGVFCRTDLTPVRLIPEKPKIKINPEVKPPSEKKSDSAPLPTSPIAISDKPEVTVNLKINHCNEENTDSTPRPASPVIPINTETSEKSEMKNLTGIKTTVQPPSPIDPVVPEVTEKHLSEMKNEKTKVVKIVVHEEPSNRRLRAKSDPLPDKRKRKRAKLSDDFLYDFAESPPKKPQEQGVKRDRQFSDIFQDFVCNEKPEKVLHDTPPASPPPSPPPTKRQRRGGRSASALDTSASETDIQTIPKRRGRPPKSAKPVENGDVIIPEVKEDQGESLPKQTPVPDKDKNRRPHRANAGKRRHSVKWDDSYDESDTTEVSESDSSTKLTGGSKDSNSGDNAPDYNLRPKRRKNFKFLQDDAIFDCECCTNGDKKHHKTLNIPHYVEHVNKVYDLRVLITRLIKTVFPDLSYPNLFPEGGLAVEYLMDEIMGACTEEHHKRKLGTPFGKVEDKVQIVLCKYPMGCLRHLRRKAMRLLDSLLPGIQSEGLEPSEINSLIEQVIETNQNANAVEQSGTEL